MHMIVIGDGTSNHAQAYQNCAQNSANANGYVDLDQTKTTLRGPKEEETKDTGVCFS